MQTPEIAVPAEEAERMLKVYREHMHFETEVDREIRRTYDAIVKGKTIIPAIAAVAAAGCGADGLPKLALCRADAPTCFMEIDHHTLRMSHNLGAAQGWGRSERFAWPKESFATLNPPKDRRGYTIQSFQGRLPLIPVHLRPRTALSAYHILWEAEWSRVVPKDPYLLRRIGKADLWVVVAAWDLTEVERAVLQARVPLQ